MAIDKLDSVDPEELLQLPEPEIPIPRVAIDGIVRTDEMPCAVQDPNWYRVTGTPQKVLQRNPRRKLVILQNLGIYVTGNTGDFILIARTKGACDQLSGYLVPSSNSLVRFELPWPDEMWCRGVTANASGGALTSIAADTSEQLLTIATFDWSR